MDRKPRRQKQLDDDVALVVHWREAFLSDLGADLGSATAVLLYLSYAMRSDGSNCFESADAIADRMHIGRRTVQRYLDHAEQLGWIKIVRIKSGGSSRGWRANHYKPWFPASLWRQQQANGDAENDTNADGGSASTAPPSHADAIEMHEVAPSVFEVAPSAHDGSANGARGGATVAPYQAVTRLLPAVTSVNPAVLQKVEELHEQALERQQFAETQAMIRKTLRPNSVPKRPTSSKPRSRKEQQEWLRQKRASGAEP